MPEDIQIKINGQQITVPPSTLVAAALAEHGINRFRKSVTGEPRSPLCGMGVCFECAVTINGQPNIRSCQTLCEDGMEIITDD